MNKLKLYNIMKIHKTFAGKCMIKRNCRKLNGIVVALVLLLLLLGCGQSTEAPLASDKVAPGGIAVPSEITSQLENMPAGEMFGYVRVDGGARQQMIISADGATASITIDNLSPGQHEIALVFDFKAENDAPPIVLANAVFPVTLVAGNNKPGFNTIEYTLPDDDNDDISNLDELVRGSDPEQQNRAPTLDNPANIQRVDSSTFVFNISASDLDGDELSFSVVGGDDQTHFRAEVDTGVLSFKDVTDFNNPLDSDKNNTYMVTIQASDGYLTAQQTITVVITEQNAAPVFNIPTNIQLMEKVLKVVDINASDPNNDKLAFSIVGGDDSGKFVIDTDSVLSFKEPSDFENPLDSDANNAYIVVLEASDGDLTTQQTITVTVTNLPDIAEVSASIPSGAAIVPANMRAYVRINNGERRLMELDALGESSGITFADLKLNESYTFALEIDYLHGTYGVIGVASASLGPIPLAEGVNNVNFNDVGYVYPNGDGDQLNNLQEIMVGSNPLISDLDIIVGASPLSKEVTLNWSKPFVDHFNVYVSTDENCDINNYTACGEGAMYSVVDSPFTITGLTNGKPYYIQIESVYSVGISVIAPQISSRPNRLVVNGSVNGIATDAAGNAYIGGSFTHVGSAMGGWLPINKVTGNSGGEFPVVVGKVYASVSDGVGGWYIGGKFTHVNKLVRGNLAHILSDGSVDPNWVPAANDTVLTLGVENDVVYIGGDFTSIGMQARNRLAAIASNGSLLPWDPDANDRVSALAVADGIVYVGGAFLNIGGNIVTRVAAISVDGLVRPVFADVTNSVDVIVIDGNTIYIGGSFTRVKGQVRNYLAALNKDGTLLDWNPDTNGRVSALATTGDTVYIGGSFTSIGGQTRNNLAAVAKDGTLLSWNPDANDGVLALGVAGDVVYVGGSFSSIGGQQRIRLAAIESGGVLKAWNPDANGTVSTLAVTGDTVYVGGGLTSTNGQVRNHVAAIASDGTLMPWSPNVNGAVEALVIDKDTFYIGGWFNSINDQVRNHLAAISSNGTLLPWDPDANDGVRTLVVAGDTLYVGGHFTRVGGQARSRVAEIAVDGTLQLWNPDANDWVETLAVTGNTVYIGGSFTRVKGLVRNRLAAIATDGSVLAWSPSVSSRVSALAVVSNTVYVGGSFFGIDLQTRNNLAAIASDGTLLPWNSDVNVPGGNNRVGTLAVAGDNIYVGGRFNSIDDQVRNHLAAFTKGGSLLAWNPNANSPVISLAIAGNTVYMGGEFSRVGEHVQQGFARIGLDGNLLP